MHISKRTAAIASSLVFACTVLGVVGVTGQPAYATNDYCSGDICAHVTEIVNGTVTIDTWARNRTYYGHFQVYQPGYVVYKNCPTSGEKTFIAGGAGCDTSLADEPGNYKAIFWYNYSPGNYENVGEVTFPD
jgi:hypothetical protein